MWHGWMEVSSLSSSPSWKSCQTVLVVLCPIPSRGRNTLSPISKPTTTISSDNTDHFYCHCYLCKYTTFILFIKFWKQALPNISPSKYIEAPSNSWCKKLPLRISAHGGRVKAIFLSSAHGWSPVTLGWALLLQSIQTVDFWYDICILLNTLESQMIAMIELNLNMCFNKQSFVFQLSASLTLKKSLFGSTPRKRLEAPFLYQWLGKLQDALVSKVFHIYNYHINEKLMAQIFKSLRACWILLWIGLIECK